MRTQKLGFEIYKKTPSAPKIGDSSLLVTEQTILEEKDGKLIATPLSFSYLESKGDVDRALERLPEVVKHFQAFHAVIMPVAKKESARHLKEKKRRALAAKELITFLQENASLLQKCMFGLATGFSSVSDFATQLAGRDKNADELANGKT